MGSVNLDMPKAVLNGYICCKFKRIQCGLNITYRHTINETTSFRDKSGRIQGSKFLLANIAFPRGSKLNTWQGTLRSNRVCNMLPNQVF